MRRVRACRHARPGHAREDEALIPSHGGYRRLKSFQVAQLLYDVTSRFCDRSIDRRSRTHDPMVQAARSGVQNIAEGSQASGTSKKTELRLTNVARASLEELKLDYEDFLRQRGLRQWDRNDPRRRSLVDRRCTTADAVAEWVKEQREAGDGRDGPHGPHEPHGVGEWPRAGEVGESMGSIESMESIPPAPTQVSRRAGATRRLRPMRHWCWWRWLAACWGGNWRPWGGRLRRKGGFTKRLYEVRRRRRGF